MSGSCVQAKVIILGSEGSSGASVAEVVAQADNSNEPVITNTRRAKKPLCLTTSSFWKVMVMMNLAQFVPNFSKILLSGSFLRCICCGILKTHL